MIASVLPDRQRIAKLVARTRAEQGLPPKVTDPLALQRAADLMRGRLAADPPPPPPDPQPRPDPHPVDPRPPWHKPGGKPGKVPAETAA